MVQRVPSPGTTVTAAAATNNAPATTAATTGENNGNGQRSTVLNISPKKTANGNTIVSPAAVHQVIAACRELIVFALHLI